MGRQESGGGPETRRNFGGSWCHAGTGRDGAGPARCFMAAQGSSDLIEAHFIFADETCTAAIERESPPWLMT